MKKNHISEVPSVSVIIPCYNHGHYLRDAINSVVEQTYPKIEVVVVDDGSNDDTAEVSASYPQVHYIYQKNQGLSAARNKGISLSTGELLLFLDADDLLLPDAVETNVRHILKSIDAAFVSGAYDNLYESDKGKIRKTCKQEVNSSYYYYFLKYNFIGMIATVMFRRWVFNEFLYDVSLRGSEDHDLFLRITRKYKIVHHTDKVAIYRRHQENMSNNVPMMVANAMVVLKQQKEMLLTSAERKAYDCSYRSLYQQFFSVNTPVSAKDKEIFKEDIYFFYKYRFLSLINQHANKAHMLKSKLRKQIPTIILEKLYRNGWLLNPDPAVGQVQCGNLDRTTPLSQTFGFDRGGAIDRYYIENFLIKEAPSIRGRVLEIGDNSYTVQYGGERVTKSDILHVDESNESATFIGDISNAPHIPDKSFDCVIFTQTLHLIYNFKEALQTCYRILKPGGALLLTVPGISPIDHDEWKETWYWSFTDKALKKLMEENFPNSGSTEVNSFGNVFVATAFLYGMGLTEVPKKKLDYHDPHFQVIITVKAVKR